MQNRSSSGGFFSSSSSKYWCFDPVHQVIMLTNSKKQFQLTLRRECFRWKVKEIRIWIDNVSAFHLNVEGEHFFLYMEKRLTTVTSKHHRWMWVPEDESYVRTLNMYSVENVITCRSYGDLYAYSGGWNHKREEEKHIFFACGQEARSHKKKKGNGLSRVGHWS